ncbi:TolC family protein [Hyphomonas sp.]|uniref:TolC family protein n=1 Tax=Hyphomonas sp. TaxID=87 RepID=UPI0025C1FEE3|nr:TolC family protein [Hyphomonas sp.]
MTAPVGPASEVSARVAASIGAEPEWQRSDAAAASADERVSKLLGEPVTPETAVQIALANNARVQAAYERLGIAKADFSTALLPSNPVARIFSLSPDGGGADTLTAGLGFDFLGLLTLPASRTAGQAGFDAAKAELAASLLIVGGDARAALIDYVAAQQEADLVSQAAETAEASAFAADRLYEAGNIAKVERDQEALFAARIGILRAEASAALVPARERLIAALALNSQQAGRLQTIRRLPAPPKETLEIDGLEDKVISSSSDLAIASGALRAAEARRAISWLTSLLPGLSVEAEREREDENWSTGFGLEGGLPVADLGGAGRLRDTSEQRQRAAIAEALDLELRAEARSRFAAAEAARQIAEIHRTSILPLSADVFEGMQLDFNAMQIGILDLLKARSDRLDAGLQSIRATAGYWRAQSDLDLLLAGLRSAAPAANSLLPLTASPVVAGH